MSTITVCAMTTETNTPFTCIRVCMASHQAKGISRTQKPNRFTYMGVSAKKAATLALGILTSVGGFFDVGNIATSVQAGAVFRLQLLWPLVLGTILVIFLIEMSGRFSAVTRQALPDAIRTHLGFAAWLGPFLILSLVHFLVLGAEIGGICFALHLVTGLPVPFWALPVAALTWLFLWRTSFSAIENSSSLLGLITLAFVVAAWHHHPPAGQILARQVGEALTPEIAGAAVAELLRTDAAELPSGVLLTGAGLRPLP